MFGLFLKGKTAVVTGSLSGIGLGIAKSLSAAGANIVLNGFASPEQIAQVEKELNNANSKAKFIHADLTKPADGRTLIERSIAHFGQVDILVNNAGIQHVDKVDDFPEQMWEKIVAVNLSSNFYTTRYAIPGMRQRQWGRIINVASVHGLVGSPLKSAYVAAKHGVVGFTKSVALEVAKEGITVNSICPGFILTPLIQKQIDIIAAKRGVSDEEAKVILSSEKHPNAKFGAPSDVGALTTFLCTDPAAQITGSSYTIDGGWTAV